jgi:hypothetical protein
MRILTIHFGVRNMSFLSKVELKRQLQALGVKVEGNYVRKKDIKKILGGDVSRMDRIEKIIELFPEIKKQSKFWVNWDEDICLYYGKESEPVIDPDNDIEDIAEILEMRLGIPYDECLSRLKKLT